MAYSKRTEFSDVTQEIADVAKALAHPARVAIIQELSKYKNRTCKELVAELPLSQPTVSRHLSELLESGLVCRTIQGSQSLYCVQWNGLERAFLVYERFSNKMMPHRPRRNCC